MYATTLLRAPCSLQPIVLADAVERQDPFQSCVCVKLKQASLNVDVHCEGSNELSKLAYSADYDLVDLNAHQFLGTFYDTYSWPF